MPPASPSRAPDAALGPASFVPLWVRGDGSAFANAAVTRLRGCADPVFAGAMHHLGATEPVPPLEMRDASSEQHIRQLAHQPHWIVWFLDAEKTPPASLALTTPEGAARAGAVHLVFIHVPEGSTLDLPKLNPADGAIFLLTETADGLTRQLPVLAAGVAGYAYAGWRRFCDSGNPIFREALLLPLGGGRLPFYTLGLGQAGPDMAHHTARWARRIESEVRDLWLRDRTQPPQAEFPRAKELVDSLLPRPEFSTKDGAMVPPGNEVIACGEVVTVDFNCRLPLMPSRRLWGAREQLMAAVVAANDYYFRLKLAAQPQAARIILQRTIGLEGRIAAPLARAQMMPDDPFAFFAMLKGLLGACGSWLEGLAGASFHSPPIRLAHQKIVEARTRVEGTPNLPGGLLRLALILTAVIWLALGPAFVRGAEPLADPDLRRTLYLLLAGGVLLLVAVPLRWSAHVWQTWKLTELAMHCALVDLLLAITRQLANALRAASETPGSDIVGKQAALEQVRSAFADAGEPLPVPPNPLPKFPAETVDAVTKDAFRKCPAEAHRLFIIALGTAPGDWKLNAALWKATLADAATATAAVALDALRFDALAEHLNFTAQQKAQLLETCIRDSRRPAFPTAALPQHNALCLVSPGWAEFRGNYDQVVFEAHRGAHLVVITPIAIQT